MTLKDLRDFINALDLNEVQSDVELVVHVHDDSNAAKGYSICDNMVDFDLFIPDDSRCKPYLSIFGETFIDFLDSDKED